MFWNKTLSIVIVTIFVMAAVVTGFYYTMDSSTSSVQGQPVAIDTNATAESVASLAEAINVFSCHLFQKLIGERGENHFFSPYSVFVALAMTYEGAQYETADELYQLLNVPQHNDTMLCSFGRIYNLLNQKKEYTLQTANALWVKEDYPFLPEYLNFIENYYMGKATEVDFTNPQSSSQSINNWASEQTNGKITDLVSPDSIDPLTALILTNAIYFKGTWIHEFDPAATFNSDFEITPERTITVPMMHTSLEINCNYTETDDAQIIELPYKGEKISIIIVLPKENNISLAETMITPSNISTWVRDFNDILVDVSLPKFTFKTEYDLKKILIDMGLNTSFTQNADFSGMTGQKDLMIDKVIHKAFIEVNEEGTEAAAATTVHMVLTSVPQTIQFDANHPFVYFLYDRETGTILFMGEVVDPSN